VRATVTTTETTENRMWCRVASGSSCLRWVSGVSGRRLLSRTAHRRSPEPRVGSVHVNGVELHYSESTGPTGVTDVSLPPIIALPGALGTAETDFGPQLRGLASELQVVSFDPRG
jgi:hypothetical protein